LHLLFKLRGARQVPSDVIVVAMDKTSASHLQLPSDPTKWPRSLHAHLIDRLVEKNVAVIAFDVIFSEARDPGEDNLFAEEIRNADSVILCDWIKKYPDSLPDFKAIQEGYVNYEEIVPPIPSLAQSAVASAPFALPRVPIKVNSYWAFKTGSGDTPTFPVVVFQFFALQVYDEFMGVVERGPSSSNRKTAKLPGCNYREKKCSEAHQNFKRSFWSGPSTSRKNVGRGRGFETLTNNPKKKRILKSLIRFYQGPKSHYLNFYGPPGMITTIPYYLILEGRGKIASDSDQLDLKGKVVFVGHSERLWPGQKDGFIRFFRNPMD
jgi:adenylate cyclase